jgi:hypothetical protein
MAVIRKGGGSEHQGVASFTVSRMTAAQFLAKAWKLANEKARTSTYKQFVVLSVGRIAEFARQRSRRISMVWRDSISRAVGAG